MKEALAYTAAVALATVAVGLGLQRLLGYELVRRDDAADIRPDVPPAPSPTPTSTPVEKCMWTAPELVAADGGVTVFEVPCAFFWAQVLREKREAR